ALLYKRYRSGGWPLAVVSMDNCSHNGEKLQSSVLAIASAWVNNGLVESGFLSWFLDDSKITFPWSMIDKITPRPAETVEAALKEKGIEDMHPIVTAKNTFIAPFVNAEKAQYLVIEDSFPNGRPPLEQAGVFLTDRDTVNRVERMKVTTCLNPLHTAMSVYGCLLGYTRIWQEMQDADIVALITRLGYVEGLPVVTDPGILDPKEFLREVLEVRLPNPFMPDAPQRIATDTSQKVGIRFGETVKSYVERNLPLSTLVSLPLALAGWFRYLLAVDDALMPIEVSQDPMKEELQRQLMGVVPGQPLSYRGQLRPILQNVAIFGMDLTKTPLAGNVEAMFIELLQGAGAVRDTLHRHLAE
ncbi:MAG: mannitol dehydrogenase family protein, partial [Eubacteriales bacterium]|nr:mannitol dehydrogenase family protein [Eubacteriales bacterium]